MNKDAAPAPSLPTLHADRHHLLKVVCDLWLFGKYKFGLKWKCSLWRLVFSVWFHISFSAQEVGAVWILLQFCLFLFVCAYCRLQYWNNWIGQWRNWCHTLSRIPRVVPSGIGLQVHIPAVHFRTWLHHHFLCRLPPTWHTCIYLQEQWHLRLLDGKDLGDDGLATICTLRIRDDWYFIQRAPAMLETSKFLDNGQEKGLFSIPVSYPILLKCFSPTFVLTIWFVCSLVKIKLCCCYVSSLIFKCKVNMNMKSEQKSSETVQ